MPEINSATVRVTPECFARWLSESDGHVEQRADGAICTSGECIAVVDDRGHLKFTCDIREGFTIFLTAAPGEWHLAGE